MSNDLERYSDEQLITEVARRLRLRVSSWPADDEADVLTLRLGLPAFAIPDGLKDLQHDSDAIRQLLRANSRRGLRRCEIAEAFRKADRPAFNIDQKVQHLKNELVREIGPDGRPYWRLAKPDRDEEAS